VRFGVQLADYLWKWKFFDVRNGSTQQMKLKLEIIGDDLYGERDGITCCVVVAFVALVLTAPE
jgi:hypothetical protein